MKNLKKVLALVLAFACAFTMFAGALTFSDVKPGDDYSAAITMLSDLEVISGDGKGNYNPTGTITRAEACVLIANMMNGGKADTARFAGGSNFSDVPKTYWGESAIAYCVQNGVTYGVGGGKFAPTRQITDAEFVAMVTRAMGYDTAANPLSFPYGNYTAAVNNGIVDNVPYVEGSPCTRGEAAQIIYDCLFADYARYTANQNVIHNSDDHIASTLIEVVFGLHRAANADDDKCTQHYWVILGESCEDEDVIFAAPITDKKGEADYSAKAIAEFECEADVSALIGRKVVLWGENTHATSSKTWEVDTVKAVETVNGQKAYDYNPTMDWEDDLDLDEVKTAYLKGVASSKIENYIETKNGNSYVLFDWDDDKEIDFISVTERYYGEVDTLTSKKVIVDIEGKSYTLDLADGEYTFDCTELPAGYCCDKAVKHDYEVVLDKDVEEGDVVEITVEDTFDQTLVITINKVDSETKELTKIDSKGKVYFDDEKMTQADNRFVNDDVNDLVKSDVDTDYDVWTNANGYIIKIDEASESDDGYFLVLGVEDGKKSSIASRSTKATLDVMFTDGTTAELDVAFDADGGDIDEYYDKDTYEFDAYDEAEGDYIVGGVFKYKLNDDGDIEKIVDCEDEVSNEYEFDAKYDELKYTSALAKQSVKNTVKFTGKDFVFVVDKDYVEYIDRDSYTWQETMRVDKDLVVCLTIDDLKDIDAEDTATAEYGRYDGLAGAIAGLDDKDQNGESEDYADGALLVVDDINDYTGSKSHVVGAVTDVSVNSKGVYTFEMNEDETYSTGKTDKDKTLFEDGFKISEADDEIIETIASGKNNVKTYGYVLYADLTIRNDEVVAVALLVKDNDASEKVNMVPKTDDDFKGAKVDSDYRVVRGIIDRVVSDEVRILTGAIAASDETIYTIDEYMDVAKVSYELNDDTVVFATNEIPGLVTGKALNGHIAYDKDFEITKDGKLEESIFNSKTGTDTYYVVDLIVDVDDGDEPVAAAYTFDDVEDEIPADKVEYVVKAWNNDGNTKAVAFNVTKKTSDFTGVLKDTALVDLIAKKDVTVTVTVKRMVADDSTYGDIPVEKTITLSWTNVRMANNGQDVVVELADELVAGDVVTVSVEPYGVAPAFTFAE